MNLIAESGGIHVALIILAVVLQYYRLTARVDGFACLVGFVLAVVLIEEFGVFASVVMTRALFCRAKLIEPIYKYTVITLFIIPPFKLKDNNLLFKPLRNKKERNSQCIWEPLQLTIFTAFSIFV